MLTLFRRKRRAIKSERELNEQGRRILQLEAELDAERRKLEVAQAEIDSMAAVIARDRERVKAETAEYAKRCAVAEVKPDGR